MISKAKSCGHGLLVAVAALMALPAVGCGSAQTGSVEYSVSAQRNYEKGLESLKREDWVAAAKYFAFIKNRFPYSKFATLSELRVADAEFGAEQYAEAIDGYRVFIRLHPTHEMVANGYASFRIGEAYYKQLTGDSWILPPASEGDQSANEDAALELTSYVEKYPQSPYREKAQEILRKVGKKLADHEWYAAQYYWKPGAGSYVAYNYIQNETVNGTPTGSASRLRYLGGNSIGLDELFGNSIGIDLAPNPADESALVTFSTQGNSTIEVFNDHGQVVQQLALGHKAPGIHQERIDTSSLPAGLYTVVIRSATGDQGVKRLMVQ